MDSRAVIYARQSHTTDGSASFDIQLEVCRSAVERFGLTVIDELVEPPSTSAYVNRGRDRTRFRDLVEMIERGEVDAVAIYSTDRMSRGGGVGWAPLLDAIERAGKSPNRFVLSPTGWMSEVEIGLRAVFDREESEKISLRMRDVRAREAREGKPRPAIRRPYGYEYSTDTKKMTLVPSEAAIIRECADRVLAGESAYSVAKDLGRQGIPSVTKTGWSTSVLLTILRSARIAGLRSHHGKIVAVGQWEPIITEAEHERLLVLTANRRSHGPKSAPRTYPLIGFLRCGMCDQPLRSQTRKDGDKRGRRYSCRSSDNLGGCGKVHIKAEFVEEAVRDYVIGAITAPGARERILAAAPKPEDTDRVETIRALQDLDQQRQRLTDLAVDGVITPAEVRRKNLELDDRHRELQRLLAASPAAALLATIPVDHDGLREAWDTRGIHFQRSLIGLLVDRVTVDPAERTGRSALDRGRLRWSVSE